ncbi:MAG TPA: NAD(P)-dependent oxidoreductase [Anaerolineae bacterium]|nr:NAD(P)-dependent oxidoreductase [Anaerolineae bacterium]
MQEDAERTANRKERLQIPHTPYAVRLPEERVKDFDDIVIGYTAEEAMLEAGRCLICPTPAACAEACPLHNDIPGAMWLIAHGDFIGAANLYRQTSIFPEICGRVCPQEKLCEGACAAGKKVTVTSLGKLEMFVADYQREREGWPTPSIAEPTGYQVAVVGSGPAGLAVAEALLMRGHAVTVYEALPYPGGLLMYGIPNFKLPKTLVMEKIEFLKRIGVQFVCDARIGATIKVDDLFEMGFDAVFIGVGANVDAQLKAPGVALHGIYQAGEFLIRSNPPRHIVVPAFRDPPTIGKRVAVIGGGDTATDCLRTALRLGAEEVTCYYRRTEAEMPGSKRERKHAVEEGARIEYLVAPVKFIGDERGQVRAMELQRMELGAPDESGRRRPVPLKGSEFTAPIDTVVLALGYWPDETLGKTTPDLKTHDYGLIDADDRTGRTSRVGVFAGGDAVTGPDLVSTAVAAGFRAAHAIDEYLKGGKQRVLLNEAEPDVAWVIDQIGGAYN